MTIKQIIDEYTKKIREANDKKTATAEVIKKINNLTYAENGITISDEDKKKILAGLSQELLNESCEIFAQDNKEYLELLNQAVKMLGGK